MKRIVFWLILRPLILRDYRLRQQGVRRDRWYWADSIAAGWGMWCA